LITILLKADLITAVQFENVRAINFQRAARIEEYLQLGKLSR